MEELTKDRLNVKIYDTRKQLGESAARDAYEYIKNKLKEKNDLNIIFAAAPSQNEFLDNLIQFDIDWSKINAFHMDEYIGLEEDAPQRFGNFLKLHIFDKVNFKSIYYLYQRGKSLEETAKEYEILLNDNPPDIVFMGIGENGHIAFNDPHVASFNDKEIIKIVSLDETCRMQQVNDNCFTSIDKVPSHALTLTIPALMQSERVFCVVPGVNKANAVKTTLLGEISESCPASILRTHPYATLYCDNDSAKFLS